MIIVGQVCVFLFLVALGVGCWRVSVRRRQQAIIRQQEMMRRNPHRYPPMGGYGNGYSDPEGAAYRQGLQDGYHDGRVDESYYRGVEYGPCYHGVRARRRY